MLDRVDVCVVGSANLDLVATTVRHPLPGETVLGSSYAEHPGGKGLNQAVAASRSGATTAFLGALGNDPAADRLRSVLAAEQIDARAVRTVESPTGRALIVVDAEGENSIVVVPGANATVRDVRVPPANVVLAQLEIPIDSVVAALTVARSAGSTVILNPAPAAPLPPDLVAACDVIVPNEHELSVLGGAAVLLAGGCGAVVVTLGSAGVEIHTSDGLIRVPAFEMEVVDTTGAGDAFCGSLAARLSAGADLHDAVRWAAAAGALATTVHGAVPAQPTAAAISRLLSGEFGPR